MPMKISISVHCPVVLFPVFFGIKSNVVIFLFDSNEIILTFVGVSGMVSS